jgi:hypothetical protein
MIIDSDRQPDFTRYRVNDTLWGFLSSNIRVTNINYTDRDKIFYDSDQHAFGLYLYYPQLIENVATRDIE